jgi:glycosyltransferase involved in cell wall biosynthesis
VSVPQVLLDARTTRRMSVGMTAYANELAARLPRVAPDLGFEVYRRGGNFGIDEQIRLPLHIRSSAPDIVHFLSLYTPLVMPRPFTLTIHDLIHLRFPQYFKRSVGPYYATVVRSACARAAFVITDDPRTSVDLERLLGVDPRKTRVVPLGVDDIFLKDVEPEGAERPYFLYAGNHREHKDLPTLVAAWRALPDACDVDLYLSGPDDVIGLNERSRARGVLRFLGEVPPARLARLYRGATAYVHPALCEGFGLPMLEAACAGSRVIACADALPAVLRGLADTFAPRDVRGLALQLEAALDTPFSDQQRAALRDSARRFTWDRCAAATAEVYREMLADLGSR